MQIWNGFSCDWWKFFVKTLLRFALTWTIFILYYIFWPSRVNWYCVYFQWFTRSQDHYGANLQRNWWQKQEGEEKACRWEIMFFPFTLTWHSEVECRHALKILTVLQTMKQLSMCSALSMLLEHLMNDSPTVFITEEELVLLFLGICYALTHCFPFPLLFAPGSVDVSVDSLDMGAEVEKWYPVTMESNKTNGGESSSIRLRFKYQVSLAHCMVSLF